MTEDDFLDLDRELDSVTLVPALTVLFHRTFPTYTETMWVHGYPAIRSITITHLAVGDLPGCVRTIPVGWRDMASADTFRARFEQIVQLYAGEGWKRKDHVVKA